MLKERFNPLNCPRTSVFLSGLLAKFCFCKGFTLPLLAPVMFYVLLFSVKNCANPFSLGFVFGVSYFGSTLFWVAESFKCVGLGAYGYVAVLVLVLYLSIYPAIACFMSKKFSNSWIELLVFFPVFWTICEYIRGWMFTGFPWNLIGYATYDIPYFPQIADVFGIYGVSFVFLLSICLAMSKKTIFYGLAVFCFTILYGVYKYELFDNYVIPKTTNNILIVQPSISQEDKMNRKKLEINIEKHLNLSRLGVSENKLIIWPEAAVGFPLNAKSIVSSFLESNHISQVFVVTGTDRMSQDRELFNSLQVIGKDSDTVAIYDKRHLLPFGEFIPKWLLDIGLRKVVPGVINYVSGKQKRTVALTGFDKFNVIICYEIIFPGKIIDDYDSTWILNITNDAWFKDSDGPNQHLRTTCFRAIEEGRSIARCANNGISCIIDCHGQIFTKLDTDIVGNIEYAMPMKYQNTVFSNHKNSTILVVLFLICVFVFCNKLKKLNVEK
jgi:apolipoprotein N-acyltransferase